MKKVIIDLFNLFFKLFKVKKNKIIFQSSPDKIDGNPYALYKYIKENCPNDFETRWLITDKTDISLVDKKECSYSRTFRYYYDLATAKYWIRSHFTGSILRKKKNQVYLQLWHGWGNFKKCGYDIEDKIPLKDRKPVSYVSECTCYLAAEKYIASCMRTSIGFDKPIEEFGMGRTDYLVNLDQKEIDRLKKKYNLPKNKKTILYAPTFRDNNLENDNFELPILSLKNNKNINVIVCLHPIVAKSLKINKLPSNFYNFSGIDITELSIISDALITDYSSTIFDYSILEKPMIFYMYDIDEYLKYRAFYLDYKKDLPGPIVKTEKELYNLIENIDKVEKEYKKKLMDFKKKYNYMNDGHINERIVNKIKENYFDKYL